MIILTIKELTEEGIDIRGKEFFVFQNKSYKRIKSISKRFQDEIYIITAKHDAEGLSSIVVEHTLFFSIWKEEKPLDETKENLNDFVNQKLKEFGL